MKIFSLVAKVCLCFCLAQQVIADANQKNPIVTIEKGQISGIYDQNVKKYKFLGIPYAMAPEGVLRFKAPVEIQKWEGVKATKEFGPSSAQAFDEHEGSMEDFGGDLTNEDSLSLNVITPSLDGKRPVMVWIHGGGNAHGSSRVPGYHGDSIVQRGDVVFVSLNYRLGIFGFIDMSLIGGEEYAGSANNGLRDQMLALKWVRKNIEKFGGDPNNITAFGNSAGATDLSAMLGSKNPKQYFDRVILQSGAAFFTRSPAASKRMNQDFFERMGVKDIKQIVGLPTDQLIEMQEKALNGMLEADIDLMFQPTMDGGVIRQFPMHAIQKGEVKDIDMLIGSTKNELMLYTLYDPQMLELEPVDLPQLEGFSLHTRKIIDSVYKWNRVGEKPGKVSMDVLSDYAFRIPAIRMAEAQSKHTHNAWMYRFDWEIPGSGLGSPHGIELPFLFGKTDSLLDVVEGVDKVDREWKKLANRMQDVWVNFARHGNPAQAFVGAESEVALREWQPYSTDNRSTLLLNSPITVKSDPAGFERILYDGIPFDGYFDPEEAVH